MTFFQGIWQTRCFYDPNAPPGAIEITDTVFIDNGSPTSDVTNTRLGRDPASSILDLIDVYNTMVLTDINSDRHRVRAIVRGKLEQGRSSARNIVSVCVLTLLACHCISQRRSYVHRRWHFHTMIIAFFLTRCHTFTSPSRDENFSQT